MAQLLILIVFILCPPLFFIWLGFEALGAVACAVGNWREAATSRVTALDIALMFLVGLGPWALVLLMIH
jgi:hypothetical protein